MPEEEGNQAVVTSEQAPDEAVAVESTPTTETPQSTSQDESTKEEPVSKIVETDDGEVRLKSAEQLEQEATERKSKGAEARKEQLNAEIADLQQQVGDQKQQDNREIRDLLSQRNTLREQIAQANAQAYGAPDMSQLPTVEQLMTTENPDTEEFYTKLEAQVEVIKRHQEMERNHQQFNEYNNRIADSVTQMMNETDAVLRDFPWADSEKKDAYDPILVKQADTLLANNTVYDQKTGYPIGARQSIYQIYEALNVARTQNMQQAEADARRAAEQQRDNLDVVGTGASTAKSYSKMSLAEKEAYLKKRGHDI